MPKNTKGLTPEELDQLQKEAEEREAAAKAELERKEALLAEEREKRARAEGAAEALKNVPAPTQQQQREWSEDEWAAWEEKNGMKREALVAFGNFVDAKTKGLKDEYEERAKRAEERAKAIEDKYSQFEKGRTYESAKNDYLKKHPEYSRYESEFDEFIKDFPDDVKNDKAKLDSVLSKAAIYVKGKIGDKEMHKSYGGSRRFGSGEDEEEGNETEEADLSDLRDHERLTVQRIIPDKDKMERLKKYRHDVKGDSGVMISSREEFDKWKGK